MGMLSPHSPHYRGGVAFPYLPVFTGAYGFPIPDPLEFHASDAFAYPTVEFVELLQIRGE